MSGAGGAGIGMADELSGVSVVPNRSAPPPLGMWDDERGSPWTYALLYALAIVAGLMGAHFYAWGFA